MPCDFTKIDSENLTRLAELWDLINEKGDDGWTHNHCSKLKEAVEILKESGGKVVYDEDLKDYYHYCPNCK